MKLIIAGSRDFTNQDKVNIEVDKFLSCNINSSSIIEIISGGARGADKMGEIYAQKKGYKIVRFEADWNNLGRSAGYIRNKDMVKYGTHLIVFWDSTSKGTKHMIDLAHKFDLIIRIVMVQNIMNKSLVINSENNTANFKQRYC